MYEIDEVHRMGYVDAHLYAQNPQMALAELVPQGLFFSGGKRRELIEKIADIDDFEAVALFDRIGWNGRHFVYPDGQTYSPSDEPSARVIFPIKPEKCHQSGSLEGWMAGVANPLSGHVIAEFAMMIPFAGPLRAHTTRVENFGWEFVGPKATGKSVLLQLMAPSCGGSLNGEEGSFLLTFAATSAGIEWEIQNYSDMVMLIDEGNLFELSLSRSARGKALTQLLMSLGKGNEKRRYKALSRSFKFVFATAANEHVVDIVGGTSATDVVEAVSDRLMTIPVADREFGTFDRVPEGFAEIGDFIASLVQASSEHHGLAMRHYLANLVSLCEGDLSAFKARLEEHIAEFRQHACVEANAGSARRVAEAFGMVYAAGRLAVHVGALPQSFSPLASTLACYRMHKAAFRTEPSPADILIGLIDDPQVVDLDQGLPSLSDRKFVRTKAFKRTNRSGSTEILVTPASIRRLIPNWNQVRRDDYEVACMIVREEGRHTVKRRVRVECGADRVICIVPPSRH